MRDTLEGITDLHEMIAAVIRSALVDEALQSGLRTRLEEMRQRLARLEERGAKKRQLALDAEIEGEARRCVDATYDDDADRILDARMSGVHQKETNVIFNELLSERPFQAPEVETLPAAKAFLTLIEAADFFDILGKLNRYEVALMNIASRQRQELEAHRASGEDSKIIDL